MSSLSWLKSFEAPFGSFFRQLSCWLVLYFRCCCWLAGGVYCSLMLLRRNCFLCTQCPKISVLLFNDGLDMKMEKFFCRHNLLIYSPGAYGFTFFIICRLMLKSVFFFFNFQMWSLRVVVVLLCSSLNDDLWRLNLVLNSFSVSPMYVSCFFVSVSVTVAL